MCAQHRILPTAPGTLGWDDYMGYALQEAELAFAKQEVPVGAVVLAPDGVIIGRGHNSSLLLQDPTAHAEVLALRSAAAHRGNYRLNGCFLLVTLEPCLMCFGALVHARIAGVLYGAADPKSGVINSRLEALEFPFLNHVPWQCHGIRAADSQVLLQKFFAMQRQGLGKGRR